MIRLFIGYDPREAVGTHVFTSSVIRHASMPVSITALHLPNLKGYSEQHEDGTNAFIYTRFLVPWLCDYTGWAIFADGADMLCRADIAELWSMREMGKAVQVVKHDYISQHTRKYIGTPMEAPNRHYDRKNWSSLMIMDCSSFLWRQMKPDTVARMTGAELHRFSWIPDDRIGALPPAWNHLVLEQPDDPDAKIVHYTLGVPGFDHYKYSPFSDEWRAELSTVTHADNG